MSLASVDQMKQHFVSRNTLHHLVVTKTLNIHISEIGRPKSKIYFLFFLDFSSEQHISKQWIYEYGLQNCKIFVEL